LSYQSIAQKCTLPVRTSGEPPDSLNDDNLPNEVKDAYIEELALRAFFYDYCVTSMNRSLSRGYLDGLESLLHCNGRNSDLAQACKVVAFANHGNKLYRPILLRKAQIMYHDLLGCLARTIADPANSSTVESLMIAVLLGLYEVCVELFEAETSVSHN
jgi:hypothetical protein